MEFAKIMYMKCLEADIFSWVFIKYEVTPIWRSPSHWESSTWDQPPNLCWANHLILNPSLKVNPHSGLSLPIGSMYAIYGNIYHQYTLNVSIYTSTMDPLGNQFWMIFRIPMDPPFLEPPIFSQILPSTSPRSASNISRSNTELVGM